MPTQTFFHLPEGKQRRLIETTRIEFSRVPLKEVSTASIVKLADIPRGSFYQYFEDKEGFHFYHFEIMRRGSSEDMLQLMKEFNGDLLKGFESYFPKMIYEILEGGNVPFYRNLFMNMDHRASRKVVPHVSRQKSPYDPHKEHKQDVKELLESAGRIELKIENDHELGLLIQLVMNTVPTTIVHSYRLLSTSEDYSVE